MSLSGGGQAPGSAYPSSNMSKAGVAMELIQSFATGWTYMSKKIQGRDSVGLLQPIKRGALDTLLENTRFRA